MPTLSPSQCRYLMACIGDSRKLRRQRRGRDFNQEQIEEEILDVLRSGSARLEEQNRKIREIAVEMAFYAGDSNGCGARQIAAWADRLERVIDNDTT